MAFNSNQPSHNIQGNTNVPQGLDFWKHKRRMRVIRGDKKQQVKLLEFLESAISEIDEELESEGLDLRAADREEAESILAADQISLNIDVSVPIDEILDRPALIKISEVTSRHRKLANELLRITNCMPKNDDDEPEVGSPHGDLVRQLADSIRQFAARLAQPLYLD